jgi:hypothetical protein
MLCYFVCAFLLLGAVCFENKQLRFRTVRNSGAAVGCESHLVVDFGVMQLSVPIAGSYSKFLVSAACKGPHTLYVKLYSLTV